MPIIATRHTRMAPMIPPSRPNDPVAPSRELHWTPAILEHSVIVWAEQADTPDALGLQLRVSSSVPGRSPNCPFITVPWLYWSDLHTALASFGPNPFEQTCTDSDWSCTWTVTRPLLVGLPFSSRTPVSDLTLAAATTATDTARNTATCFISTGNGGQEFVLFIYNGRHSNIRKRHQSDRKRAVRDDLPLGAGLGERYNRRRVEHRRGRHCDGLPERGVLALQIRHGRRD